MARQRAREVAKALGFGAVDQSRIATAVSELTRNVVRYATDGRGEVLIRALAGTRAWHGARDRRCPTKAPASPTSTRRCARVSRPGPGMGMGLPGTKRLMDEMEIDSVPGRGTLVTIRKWRR